MEHEQDRRDREKGEAIARRAMDLAEAFLDGRAAIVIVRENTGKADPDTGDPIMETHIRLKMDRRV